MRITVPIRLNNLETSDPAFMVYLSQLINQMQDILNGHIGFIDNCNTAIMKINFVSANTTQAFTHGLNRIPNGYILVGAGAATQIYDGTQANTTQTLYLQSTVATSVKILVF